MIEVWTDIQDFPNYMVSSHGRVKSKARTVVRKQSNGVEILQPIQEKLLKPAINPVTGYKHVSLRNKGKSVSKHVHILVADAFVAGKVDGYDVCHNNGIRTINDFNNLRWDTRTNNFADMVTHGTKLQGETQNGAKLTESSVKEIREHRERGMLWKDIAALFGVSTMTAYNAGTGKTWKHI